MLDACSHRPKTQEKANLTICCFITDWGWAGHRGRQNLRQKPPSTNTHMGKAGGAMPLHEFVEERAGAESLGFGFLFSCSSPAEYLFQTTLHTKYIPVIISYLLRDITPSWIYGNQACLKVCKGQPAVGFHIQGLPINQLRTCLSSPRYPIQSHSVE